MITFFKFLKLFWFAALIWVEFLIDNEMFYKINDALLVYFFGMFWQYIHTLPIIRLNMICLLLNTIFISLILIFVTIFFNFRVFVINDTFVVISILLVTRFLVVFINSTTKYCGGNLNTIQYIVKQHLDFDWQSYLHIIFHIQTYYPHYHK